VPKTLGRRIAAIATVQAAARSRSAVLVSTVGAAVKVERVRSFVFVVSVATKGNAILFAMPTKKPTARLALAARLQTGCMLASATRIFAQNVRPARPVSLAEANGVERPLLECLAGAKVPSATLVAARSAIKIQRAQATVIASTLRKAALTVAPWETIFAAVER